MTQETIDKLHYLENARRQWANFKVSLETMHELKCDAGTCGSVSRDKTPDYHKLETILLSTIDNLIDDYNKQIEEL